MVDENRRKLLGAALATSGVLATGGRAAAREQARTRSGTATQGTVMGLAKPKLAKVRFGFVGVGMRGHELLRLLLAVDGVEVNGLCDTFGPALETAAALVTESRGNKPRLYSGSDTAYKALVEQQDIDAVVIATPWQWHAPMALDSMAAGKETFVEVPAALSVEDCWKLVEASEKNRVNCMMLENCCYGRSELMVLNMVQAGVLGELNHAEGAYIHNLYDLLVEFHDHGEGSWRPQWYTNRKANAYPTHGLGPIAQYMGINRGDRFDFIVSTSTFPAATKQYAPQSLSEPGAKQRLRAQIAGMNTSIIQTARGRTIMLQHDVGAPRPYSRLNLIQGETGVFAGYPDRLSLADHGGGEEWITDLAPWVEKYDSTLWQSLDARIKGLGGGHGGMDYVMVWRIVQLLRNGLPLDQNVYDAAAWSVIFDLSEQSMRDRSRPRDFPDFTRGAWRTNAPLEIKL